MTPLIAIDPPREALAAQLTTELAALALPGVRGYSIVGEPLDARGDRLLCAGVYAWSGDAPEGEYEHASLTAQQRGSVQAAVVAHDLSAADAATAAQATERTTANTDLHATAKAAMTRLDAIISGGGAYTATEVRSAVIDLSRIQRQMLRYLATRMAG